MSKITPFLWFNDNAEDAAEFYLSVFPEAKKLGELRSSGVGPWSSPAMAEPLSAAGHAPRAGCVRLWALRIGPCTICAARRQR